MDGLLYSRKEAAVLPSGLRGCVVACVVKKKKEKKYPKLTSSHNGLFLRKTDRNLLLLSVLHLVADGFRVIGSESC